MSGENETLAKKSKKYFPLKLFRVSSDIALKDQEYALKEYKVYREEAFKEKEYLTVFCQTHIDLQQMDDMIKKFIDGKS